MKKWISILIIAAILLSLVACGESGIETQVESTQEEEAEDVKTTNIGSDTPVMLSTAIYPEMAPFPNETDFVNPDGSLSDGFDAAYDAWWKDIRTQREQPEGYADGLNHFFRDSVRQFLTDMETENRVYSPLNVYLALAMLSELTDGQSRDQVLSLLGADNVESVRTQAKALWNANYRDDGIVKSVLASSLWLNESIHFIQSTLDTLAENYYASSFQGEMGSAEYNQMLQSWLNDQTGGLLSEQASGIEMDARTLLALATTIYFKAPWTDKFSESATEEELFHAPEGDVPVDFMHRRKAQSYFWGDRFSAVSLELESDGAMWFLLPDEGVTPADLLDDSQAMEFLLNGDQYAWENSKFLTVNLSVPKFDVVSDMDLIPGLRALGITDVFDYTVSDFTPMTADTDEIYVSQAKHAARVRIAEEGCEAAAYTVLMMRAGAAMPPDEEIDFKLNRPFLFCVTGAEGIPLFVGTVNTPQ